MTNQADTKLIAKWKDNWQKAGWDPIVLTENDAKLHPEYEVLAPKLKSLPSANPKGYDAACYLRWLAVAARGGGWMADYDLFNYGYPPQEPFPRMTLFARPSVPCLASGTAEAFLQTARMFADYVPTDSDKYGNLKHVSDMLILQKMPASHATVHAVDEPISRPDPWRRGALLHWSHNWLSHVAERRNVTVTRLRRVMEIERAERELIGGPDFTGNEPDWP